ncbi:methylenetetrahydrofolate reductase [NAD(P)H] [Enterobacteriaceae endosymbiont of Donacia tomentosa]|uniref:methylenetetrahydrofolate reductase [NAD(P)H] n=1 Tax=Enterobacteriaceae endosymbiont of Donacia tomentosa TaxID=2675787 RepID=UPI001449AE8B|nr:methylenetetrahydrofolate reductase [NAD(P)H] [Enterobacteriaceae endosymbiont of Donacia tomentosa]QJC31775.1 methylenetetrahydrofolate reductase [NAD(P)H] [Enterobacteriaceae endosymbiont of Donacia tomentosa]
MNYFDINKQKYISKYNNNQLSSKINISFEIFPPNENKNNSFIFWEFINTLIKFKPKFISVTYKNTNFSYNNNTFNIIKKIKKITNIELVPHLTCINMNNDQLYNIAKKYWDIGIRHIIALRGDKNFNAKNLQNNNNMIYASDLVYFLKKIANFNISVAAYPEMHPESKNITEDLNNLKRKIDAGATKAITQFFFNIETYLRFRDLCILKGININIIPGILPIINLKQLKKFINMTNITIPPHIGNIFRKIPPQNTNIPKLLGIIITLNMIQKLKSEGVCDFHFYTLNQPDIIHAICLYLDII